MAANCLQTFYGMVDMVVVGQFVGTTGLSAVSCGADLTTMFMNIGAGICTGGQVYISQLMGAKDKERVNRAVGTMFSTVAILSLILMVVGLLFHETLLTWLKTPAEAMDQAVDYLFICSLGMFFIYGYNAVSAVLRGMGDSKHPLLFVFIASMVNLVLDLLFVGVFRLGAAGAALATVMGQGVSLIFSLVFLYRRREEFGFDFKRSSFAIRGEQLKIFLKLGLPIMIQTNAVTISMLYISSMVNSFGLIASSVYGVGHKLYGVAVIVSSAISAAGGTMVGQNMGAGRPDRVAKVVWSAWCVGLVCSVFIVIGCLGFPRQIFSIFNKDPAVLDMSVGYMKYTMLILLAFMFMSPTNSLINGVGFSLLSMAIALLDGVIVRIPLCIFLCYHTSMGVYGIFLGNSLAGWVSVILGAAYFFSGAWKKRRLLKKVA